MLTPEAAAMQPLVTDDLIVERVQTLVGRAVHSQLWIMFVDENDVQLPVLMPVDDLPALPPQWLLPIHEMFELTHAAKVIVVLERYGNAAATASDRAWFRHVRQSCELTATPLRGLLLSHRAGVRWVTPDDELGD